MAERVSSAGPLLAYHGKVEIKQKYLRRVRAHQEADQLKQGYGYWKGGRGCAVGCTLHSSEHSQYPVELGIPEELAHLEDSFFERLPQKAAQEWPARFLSAIRPGANLSRVYDLWSAWNLIDPEYGVINLVTDDFPDVQKVVRETGEACLKGERVSAARAAEAAEAARAARAVCGVLAVAEAAAEAAWAAAWAAAEAAWAAAEAAWTASGASWAARAADAAAEAARAADAARTSRTAYYKCASDKLIELLEAA